ncbi:MAG TPA: phosphatase PAP2 family protein [Gemmatimonadales bacterium]|nr:phosphatase PAP2 family protein [Gemmatimonadales bacterium]
MQDARALLARPLRWLLRHVHNLYVAVELALIIALAVALAGLWGFAELAEAVGKGETQRFDDAVLLWLNRHATPTLDTVALQITAVGNGLTVVVVALVACAFLWAVRERVGVLLLAMAVAGGDLLNRVLKGTFARPRPELFVLDTPFARPVSASFPSGHATASMVLYLVLAYLLVRLCGRAAFKWVVIIVAGLLIFLIGLSRLYLGVHYPSDVIAGYLFGFVWAACCAFGIEAVRGLRARGRKEEVQPVSEAPAPPEPAEEGV